MVLRSVISGCLRVRNARHWKNHDARGTIRGSQPQEDNSSGRASQTAGRGPQMKPAVQHYQAAVQLLQQGKYREGAGPLEKLLPEAPAEIQDRCRMYITTCRRQMEKGSLSFLTPEEHYDYAISQLNTGYYEEAREQFEQHSDWPSRRRLRVLRAGGAGSDYRARAGLPEQSGAGHRAESEEPAAGARG